MAKRNRPKDVGKARAEYDAAYANMLEYRSHSRADMAVERLVDLIRSTGDAELLAAAQGVEDAVEEGAE